MPLKTGSSANGCTNTHSPNEMLFSIYNGQNSSIILKVYDSLSISHRHTWSMSK